ncbi:MAG: hypothetical protein HOI80_00020 [Alphaproteobacteria bacterium]|jgi:hypothetical protein|nr:hypothetical protein [Alphaproteobacteria bacterium]
MNKTKVNNKFSIGLSDKEFSILEEVREAYSSSLGLEVSRSQMIRMLLFQHPSFDSFENWASRNDLMPPTTVGIE